MLTSQAKAKAAFKKMVLSFKKLLLSPQHFWKKTEEINGLAENPPTEVRGGEDETLAGCLYEQIFPEGDFSHKAPLGA